MDDSLDRILSSEEEVVPSARFVRNVMAAVRREAATPAPISFPWWRVAPGLAICAIGLIAFLVVGVAQFRGDVAAAAPVPRVLVDITQYVNRIGIGWIVLAVVASIVPTRIVLARR